MKNTLELFNFRNASDTTKLVATMGLVYFAVKGAAAGLGLATASLQVSTLENYRADAGTLPPQAEAAYEQDHDAAVEARDKHFDDFGNAGTCELIWLVGSLGTVGFMEWRRRNEQDA